MDRRRQDLIACRSHLPAGANRRRLEGARGPQGHGQGDPPSVNFLATPVAIILVVPERDVIVLSPVRRKRAPRHLLLSSRGLPYVLPKRDLRLTIKKSSALRAPAQIIPQCLPIRARSGPLLG